MIFYKQKPGMEVKGVCLFMSKNIKSSLETQVTCLWPVNGTPKWPRAIERFWMKMTVHIWCVDWKQEGASWTGGAGMCQMRWPKAKFSEKCVLVLKIWKSKPRTVLLQVYKYSMIMLKETLHFFLSEILLAKPCRVGLNMETRNRESAANHAATDWGPCLQRNKRSKS